MKKRILILLTSCLLVSVSMFGQDFEIVNGVLTGYTGSGGDVVIPDEVTTIGATVFKANTTLISVTIPNSVTTIEMSAFNGCSGLTSLTIPSSVTSIETYAFAYCTSLTELTVGWNTPLPIDQDVFTDTPINNCKLIVPAGTKSLYQGAGVWGGFGTILEGEETEVPIEITFEPILNSTVSLVSYNFSFGVWITPEPENADGSYVRWSSNNPDVIKIEESPNYYSYDTEKGKMQYYAVLQTISEGTTTITASVLDGKYTASTQLTVKKESPSGITSTGLSWVIEDGLLTISGEGTMPDYDYSSTLDWHPYKGDVTEVNIIQGVSTIGNHAFDYCNLTSISIPGSVTSIGENAFAFSINLTSISISEGVTSINGNAFNNCHSLNSFFIPSSIISIVTGAFNNCIGLNAFIVDNGNPMYVSENGILYNKEKTTLICFPAGKSGSFSIPNSVTFIEMDAFRKCGLTSILIPNGVGSIGSWAFDSCENLQDVTVSWLTPLEVPEYTFYNVNLSNVTLHVPVGTKSLYQAADIWKDFGTILEEGEETDFIAQGTTSTGLTWTLDKEGLLTISGNGAMPDYSYESIEDWRFYKEDITKIIIEQGVTNIGQSAFNECSDLLSITIPNSITSIGSWSFQDCENLVSVIIPNTVTSIGAGAFFQCNNLTSIIIPNNVTSIGDKAMAECQGLTSVTIPQSVANIGTGPFLACINLTSILVEENNPNYSSQDGVLFNKDKTQLIQFPSGKTISEYTIPISVTNIEREAFLLCVNLTSVSIPDNVTSIGEYTFASCVGLTSIEIPNTVTNIGEAAFSNCYNLTSVIIPGSVTNIGEWVFADCANLQNVNVNWTAPLAISENVFNNINLSNVTLHVPAGTKSLYEAADVWKDFGTILEEGETTPIYNPGDIVVINSIIDNNGLSWSKANPADGSYVPADWSGVYWSAAADNKRIINLDISERSLTGALDLSELTNLQALYCDYNNLTSLNVLGLSNLQALYCGFNNLTSLDVSELTNLQMLNCENNNLTSLEVSKLTNLQELRCFSNNLTSLDISNLINLQYLSCGENSLTSLGILGLTNLQFLYCQNNSLTSLDVSGLTNLHLLDCYNNKLTSIDVSELTDLQRLWCDDNNLTSLDVSGLTNLQLVSSSRNKLTSLDVSGLTNLQRFYCDDNKLTSLDVSGLTNLRELYCYSNDLTSLDVSKLANLQEFWCNNNSLTSLDLTGLNSLTGFRGYSQTQALMLTGNSGNYNANVTFSTGTTFENSALSYSNGVLTSTSDAALSSGFTSPTGLAGKELTGTLTLTYPSAIPVTSVALNRTSIELIEGATEQLTATVNPSNATNKNVTWNSSNTNVATVNSVGLVTALAEGSTNIIVTTEDGNFAATCQITVNAPIETVAVAGISMTSTNKTLDVGEEFQLTVTISPSNATNKKVNWSSSDLNVATVNSTGLVTAVAAGSANIIATTEDGNFTDTCRVIVNIPTVVVTGVNISSVSKTLNVGEEFELTATVNPSNASNKKVSWSSSNANVVTVSNIGLVTAVAAGSVTITVTAEDGNFTATCEITVEDVPSPPEVTADENEPVGESGQGSIDVSLNIPTDVPFEGSFTVILPEGFSLNLDLTSLAEGLNNDYVLTITPLGNNKWQLTIASKSSLRDDNNSVYQKIVNLVYDIEKNINDGTYQVVISDLNFNFEDGSTISEEAIDVNVTVDHSYTGIQAVDFTVNLYYLNGNLYVDTPIAEYVSIYSISGNLLYQLQKQAGKTSFSIGNIPAQILIVKGSSGWNKKFVVY